MNYLRRQGSAPTSASHFLEALRFSHQMFVLQHVNVNQIVSRRVSGAAHTMFLGKRKWKQAPAFSVAAVQTLERICLYDDERHRKVIAGSILFCIFACVRWSDAMNIESVSMDEFASMIILEADTSRHKTSMTKEAKTRLLPYVCLWTFMDPRKWGKSYMDARNHYGLTKPFQPSWNETSQSWAPHPMTTAECTCWIHEFLEQNMSAAEAPCSPGQG